MWVEVEDRREAEEKRKKMEEAEKKRQEMMKAQKEKMGPAGGSKKSKDSGVNILLFIFCFIKICDTDGKCCGCQKRNDKDKRAA